MTTNRALFLEFGEDPLLSNVFAQNDCCPPRQYYKLPFLRSLEIASSRAISEKSKGDFEKASQNVFRKVSI